MFDSVMEEIEDLAGVIVRGRWIFDGARTLEEAAEMARNQAYYYEQLIELGYELEGTVDNDYGVARRQ